MAERLGTGLQNRLQQFESAWNLKRVTQKVTLFLYIPNLPFTNKVWKMTFGMASNLFHLSHNFLTHKCPILSTKRHLFKHTEILWLICNDCLRPIRIFFRPCLFLSSWAFAKKDEGILCIAAFGCPLLIYFLKMLNCLVNYYSWSKSTSEKLFALDSSV